MTEIKVTLSLDAETRAALEKIAGALSAAGAPAPAAAKAAAPKPAAAKPAEPEPEPEADPFGDDPFGGDAPAAAEKTYTREEVRAELKKYADAHSKEKAIKVLKDVGGASSIGELKEDKFSAVVAACAA